VLAYASTRRWKESDDKCISFDTIPACDGQMDGQICYNNIVCMQGMLTSDENALIRST